MTLPPAMQGAAASAAAPAMHLPTAQTTAEFGALLAAAAPWPIAPGGLRLYLHGELGSGKTSLAQGLLRALGVQGAIPSPSYTLVEPYDTAHGRVLHVDLYRLQSPRDLEPLGVRDEWLECALLLVEWPEKGGGLLPPPDLQADLRMAESGRLVQVEAASPAGETWRGAVCSAFAEVASRSLI